MATRKQYNEDLFKGTTMTFGEHLEELRTCLFKAVVGLAVGFLFGLLVGGWVVDFIQRPLSKALTKHYRGQLLKRAEAEAKGLRGGQESTEAGAAHTMCWAASIAAGPAYGVSANVLLISSQSLRDDHEALPWTEEQIEKIVYRLLPEEVYLDPAEMLRQLREVYPNELADVRPPSRGPDEKLRESDLIRVFIWHRVEDDPRIRTKSLNAHEAFMIYIKASFIMGLLAASPWIFYQIWSFVAAGLYPHEKRYVHVFLPFSLGLFLAGAALAFFFVFEPVLNFLFYFNDALGIDPDPRISEWLGFVLILPLGFGISFQLPLVMLFLERIGIFDVQAYLAKWRIAVLIVFIMGMMLTPADPYSMLLMAIPLTVLYFCGILLCKYMPRSSSPFDELEE